MHGSLPQMNLVVYGRENTSQLWNWVSTSFAKITSSNGSAVTYHTTAFPDEYTGRLVQYLPEANTNTLTIFWQTKPLQDHKRNTVGDFLVRYLGHEGEQSLLHYLRDQGMASGIGAGIEVAADSFTLFSLQITLTDCGLDGVAEVIQAVFHFTHLLANMSGEEFERKWEDYVQVAKVNFDYAEKESPNDYAV